MCAPNCSAPRLHNKDFCREHFLLLPKRIQEDLSRTKQSRDRAVKPEAKRVTRERYREACERALEFLAATTKKKAVA